MGGHWTNGRHHGHVEDEGGPDESDSPYGKSLDLSVILALVGGVDGSGRAEMVLGGIKCATHEVVTDAGHGCKTSW